MVPTVGQLRALAIALVLAAVLATGWWVRGLLAERDELRVENAGLEASLATERAIEKTTSIVLSARTASAAAIQRDNTSVQTEIALRRPGAECRLPVDWRVLHDRATGSVPEPTRGADAPSSGPAAAPEGNP